jgi:small GTP-binding protein
MLPKEFKFKVTILGNEKVGKTSLIKRYVYDKFDDAYLMTLGTKTTKKTVLLKGDQGDVEVKMVIWDIMGQREFSRAFSSFFSGSKGGILVSDMTRRTTLKNIPNWVDDLFSITGPIPLILVANKSDLSEQSFGFEELEATAKKYNAPFFMTSAKTGENVERFFYTLAKTLMERFGGRNDFHEFTSLPKKEIESQVKRRRRKIHKAEQLEKKEEFEKAKEIYDELEMWDYSKKVEFLTKEEEEKVEFAFESDPTTPEQGSPYKIIKGPPQKETEGKAGLLSNQERLQLLEDRFLLGEIDKATYDRLRKKYERSK